MERSYPELSPASILNATLSGSRSTGCYGAVEPGSKGRAGRIGLIVDPQGNIFKNYGKVSPTGFPDLALNTLPDPV